MEKRNPDLEKAIAANPKDDAAYSVLADWLQAQNEARGELIALHLAGKASQANELIANNPGYFYGPLSEHTKSHDHAETESFAWERGFIHGARLSHDSYAQPELEGGLAAVLEQLLAHPSGRFLAELSFAFNGDPNEASLDSLLEVLGAAERPTLRKLHLGDFLFCGGSRCGLYGEDTEISWYSVGDCSKLWPALPKLETLIVQSGSNASAIASGLELGTVALPALKRFELRSGGMNVDNTRAAMLIAAPKLEHLEIWFGSSSYGSDTTVDDVETSLLKRTDLPALWHLGLRNAEFTDALIPALAASPLLRQVTSLDLSLGILTDEGAQAIAKHADAFRHLERLDVSQCYLTSAGIEALKGIARELYLGEQRADVGEDRRYAAIGE